MPQVVGLVAIKLGASAFVASAIQLGAGLLLSAALRPKDQGAAQVEGVDGRVPRVEAIGSRRVAYGRNLVSGQVLFQRAGGAGSQEADTEVSALTGGQYFHQILGMCQGPISGIVETRLGGLPRKIEDDGRVLAEPFNDGNTGSLLRIETRLGAVPSAYYPGVVDAATDWSSAHRLDGIATVYIRCEQRDAADHQSVYPSGPTKVLSLIDGEEIKDPRIGGKIYTDNAALVIADWFESAAGFELPGSLHEADIIAAANQADALRGLSSGGSTAFWRLAGMADLTVAPQAVLRGMLDACGGDVRLRPDGKIGLTIGGDPDPVVTLTEDDFLYVDNADDGPDDLDRYTTLPFSYVDETMDYAETTGDPWVNESEVKRLGGEALAGSVSMSWAPQHAQARHAAKIKSIRENPPQTVRAVFKVSALPAIYERTVTLDIPSYGFSGTWRVMPFSINSETLAVTLDLHQLVGSARSWMISEEGEPLALPVEQDDPDRPPATPQGVRATGFGTTGNAGILAIYDQPSDTSVTHYVSYSLAGLDVWTAVTPGDTQTEITGLVDGSLYDVAIIAARVATTDPDNVDATDVRILSVEAREDDREPDAPNNLTATGDGEGLVILSADAPSDAFVGSVQFLRDGSVFSTVAATPGATAIATNSPPSGASQYTARAVSITGNAGPSAPSITYIAE